ncbi:MAG: oligosaccharide flippase family protein [Pseudomonadales bacterium]|nr:oligosaccharide flippase family protein [Candidatus Woesebacteria bacterium]MCB9802113.1 oligosaccharide flippase family protein [Pseudomonadales bacterium]
MHTTVLRGFSWQSVLKLSTGVLSLIKLFFLARLLTPEEFGLFSLVLVSLGITEALTQTGVNITLLQKKGSIAEYVDTAWVIALMRGVLIAVLMIVLGALLAHGYNQPPLFVLTAATALVPIIKGAINPMVVSLQKEFRFGTEAMYHAVIQSVEAVLAVVIALFFPSVWALVVALIGAAVFEVLLSFQMFAVTPRFWFSKEKGRVILEHTKRFSLNAALSYCLENVDNLLVGKLLSAQALGLYHNAYGLTHKATYALSQSFAHSSFPTFNTLQEDGKTLLHTYYKVFSLTLGVVVLGAAPLFIAPEFFVDLILGPNWTEIVPSVRWLLVAGILYSAMLLPYMVLFTLKKVQLMNAHMVLTLILMIIGIMLLGPSGGLIGVAQGLAYSRLIALPFIVLVTHKALVTHAADTLPH